MSKGNSSEPSKVDGGNASEGNSSEPSDKAQIAGDNVSSDQNQGSSNETGRNTSLSSVTQDFSPNVTPQSNATRVNVTDKSVTTPNISSQPTQAKSFRNATTEFNASATNVSAAIAETMIATQKFTAQNVAPQPNMTATLGNSTNRNSIEADKIVTTQSTTTDVSTTAAASVISTAKAKRFQDDEPLWQQFGVNNSICMPGKHETAADQITCQNRAVAANHPFYQFSDSTLQCDTVLSCEFPIAAPDGGWKIFSRLQHDVSWCQSGLIGGSVCCPASCVQCGGLGCAARPGGKTACCLDDIEQRFCEDGLDTACIIPVNHRSQKAAPADTSKIETAAKAMRKLASDVTWHAEKSVKKIRKMMAKVHEELQKPISVEARRAAEAALKEMKVKQQMLSQKVEDAEAEARIAERITVKAEQAARANITNPQPKGDTVATSKDTIGERDAAEKGVHPAAQPGDERADEVTGLRMNEREIDGDGTNVSGEDEDHIKLVNESDSSTNNTSASAEHGEGTSDETSPSRPDDMIRSYRLREGNCVNDKGSTMNSTRTLRWVVEKAESLKKCRDACDTIADECEGFTFQVGQICNLALDGVIRGDGRTGRQCYIVQHEGRFCVPLCQLDTTNETWSTKCRQKRCAGCKECPLAQRVDRLSRELAAEEAVAKQVEAESVAVSVARAKAEARARAAEVAKKIATDEIKFETMRTDLADKKFVDSKVRLERATANNIKDEMRKASIDERVEGEVMQEAIIARKRAEAQALVAERNLRSAQREAVDLTESESAISFKVKAVTARIANTSTALGGAKRDLALGHYAKSTSTPADRLRLALHSARKQVESLVNRNKKLIMMLLAPCTATDGRSISLVYPCVCGDVVCKTREFCDKSNSKCKASIRDASWEKHWRKIALAGVTVAKAAANQSMADEAGDSAENLTAEQSFEDEAKAAEEEEAEQEKADEEDEDKAREEVEERAAAERFAEEKRQAEQNKDAEKEASAQAEMEATIDAELSAISVEEIKTANDAEIRERDAARSRLRAEKAIRKQAEEQMHDLSMSRLKVQPSAVEQAKMQALKEFADENGTELTIKTNISKAPMANAAGTVVKTLA
eukprot:TRINITY_DN6328_c0_g1_i4.p1 TRINITY_DN6328_c0_g1~~TRINITY_DN6328_c0_g1_i4.p1  ORF type:complete len:1100 (-),score=244.95 TRINITY_DN6328_c0_g1_i4:400-3699(-)